MTLTMVNIFEYRNYKQLLKDLIESSEKNGRGKRKELSEFIGCQVSHITNVLSGSAHFSLEQAESAARFFGLTPSETEFFFTLLQFNRAGTTHLKKLFEQKLWEQQRRFSSITKKKDSGSFQKKENDFVLFSSWIYSAVLVLITIPEFQYREALSKKLAVSLEQVDKIINFLIESDLCKKDGRKIVATNPMIHLEHDSALINKHHLNWRLRSIQGLETPHDDDFRYSGAISLSEDDYPKVREILAATISKVIKVVAPSKSETAAVLCIDLFKL